MNKKIYLDNNATTPVAPEVIKVMMQCLREEYGNPSSPYELGKRAAKIKSNSANHLSQLIHASPREIIFTGCATEANNLALMGVANALQTSKKHLIISAIEHPSVGEMAKYLKKGGWELTVVPVNSDCLVSPNDIEGAIRPDTALVSIMLANNETGVIQPIQRIAEIAKSKNIIMHTDAAQAIGKIRVNVNDLGVDLLTVAGHKFGASKGVGALFVREGVSIHPISYGGGQEQGLRPGTENIAAIAGLGIAAKLAIDNFRNNAEHLENTRNLMYTKLSRAIPGLKLNGHSNLRLPNTLNISFPNVSGQEILNLVGQKISASVCSACHSIKQTNSTLSAMGLNDACIKGAVRLSTGWTTTEDEVDLASDILVTAWNYLIHENGGNQFN